MCSYFDSDFSSCSDVIMGAISDYRRPEAIVVIIIPSSLLQGSGDVYTVEGDPDE